MRICEHGIDLDKEPCEECEREFAIAEAWIDGWVTANGHPEHPEGSTYWHDYARNLYYQRFGDSYIRNGGDS